MREVQRLQLCGKHRRRGFHNTRTETVSLREDNSTYVQAEHLNIDHDEKNHATVEHECAFEAYCGSCDNLLLWPLYQIRSLDGRLLAKAQIKAAEIVASVEGGGGEENRSFTT
jgi:hypothetical protein